MKKYQLGLLILFTAMGLSAASHGYTVHVVGQIHHTLDTMAEKVQQEGFTSAEELAQDLLDSFGRQSNVMATYTSHVKLDEVTTSLGRLQSYIRNQSVNDSLAEINTIRSKLNILEEEEQIRMSNIL